MAMHPTVTHYATVTAEKVKELDVRVAAMIDKGYQPLGGVVVNEQAKREFHLMQTMVKYPSEAGAYSKSPSSN